MATTTKTQGKRAGLKPVGKTVSPKTHLGRLKKSPSAGTVSVKTKTNHFVSVAEVRPPKTVKTETGGALSVTGSATKERFIGQASTRRIVSREPETETELATRLVAEVDATSPDVKVLCESYGLRREELSRLTGFSLRALADWSAGKLPSQPAQRRLQEIRRLLDALAEIVKPSAIPSWMRKPNPAFDKLAPLQVIELGEIDRLWAMVHQRA